MIPRLLPAGLALLIVLGTASCAGNGDEEKTMSLSRLEDKIRGGWAGQMIGVSFGEPTEFRYLGELVPEEALPEWRPERIVSTLNQDDLYVDMTFAAVLDEKGLDATTDDFGAMFRDAEYHLWHANLAARRALRRGVPATLSGTPEYNAHANDIDFQIEADFIGLMTPGMPQASNDLCLRAGRVMNYGDGILGGVFVSGMYSAAFFESDPRRVVEAGLATLPPESPYAQVIADVLEWSRLHPDDWTETWRLVNEKWDRREPCPAGALQPFNIDAKLNGAYIALGLLYGGGDFYETMKISTRAGQDSDCNPASAAGVLGVILGYEGIPTEYTSGIPTIADEKFSYTDYTFNTIVESTLRRAIAMVERTGGSVEGDSVTVRTQEFQPAALDLWDDYGSPVERVLVDDPRWIFSGDWEQESPASRSWVGTERWNGTAGAEASIELRGTGAIIAGSYMPSGGKADIYLDGELHRTVDVYSDEDATKSHESVWHAFGLQDGEHRLRVVVRGEQYVGTDGDQSSGTDVSLSYLVVFR
ncbi:MAG: ADP-ribosylglycohydrolase family protein [Gemmatimonadota bacterium]|nr:MAG: ADP-ribosylglycohydrolase family protein [Gemmatimonadota bacterium]